MEFPEGTKLIRKSEKSVYYPTMYHVFNFFEKKIDSAVTVASILSVPILQGDGSTLAVLTMGRNATKPQFASEDEEIINHYLTWGAVALFLAQEHSVCLRQQKLYDTYEKMTKYVEYNCVPSRCHSVKLCSD